MNSIFRKLITVSLGTTIAGFGVQLIVAANMGADSVSTIILGFLNYIDIPFARWSQILSIIFLMSAFLYKKRILGIGSIINTLLFGEAISFLSIFVHYENTRSTLSCFGYLILGFIMMAFGTAIYIKGELGVGPLEGIMFCICDKFRLSVKYSRILIDFLIVFIGVVLGAPFGVGTFFAVFLLGPMIEFFLYLLDRISGKLSIPITITDE